MSDEQGAEGEARGARLLLFVIVTAAGEQLLELFGQDIREPRHALPARLRVPLDLVLQHLTHPVKLLVGRAVGLELLPGECTHH